jgi:hypothetical protein
VGFSFAEKERAVANLELSVTFTDENYQAL